MRLSVLVFCISLGIATAGISGEKKPSPKLTVAFRFASAFGQKGGGVGHFHEASAIALDTFGNLYVADTGNDRIQKFDAEGRYLSEVGTFGWDPGQFSQPTGVAVGQGGLEVYVADGRNNRIQIFSPHFRLLGVVGGRDVDGPIRLGNLGGIAVSDAGELYVSDTDADQVVQISNYSPLENQFGGYGYGADRVRRPLGLAIGRKDEVYVCDSENDRVAVFDRYGNFKKSLAEGSLSEPAGGAAGADSASRAGDSPDAAGAGRGGALVPVPSGGLAGGGATRLWYTRSTSNDRRKASRTLRSMSGPDNCAPVAGASFSYGASARRPRGAGTWSSPPRHRG